MSCRQVGVHRQHRASIVVRIWRDVVGDGATRPRDDDGDEAASVRGSVQLVGGESVRYFASLADMAEIIGEAVGIERPGPLEERTS